MREPTKTKTTKKTKKLTADSVTLQKQKLQEIFLCLQQVGYKPIIGKQFSTEKQEKHDQYPKYKQKPTAYTSYAK